MGLGDRFRKVMGIPVNPDPIELRRTAFRDAAADRDEIACLENALAFSQIQRFDDALSCFKQMEELFPSKRGEWLRWQGQTLYIGLSWRASSDADRVACFRRALACYFEAAALGDRSQEQNVVELCEALAAEKDVPSAEKKAAVDKYLASFPEGELRERAQRLD